MADRLPDELIVAILEELAASRVGGNSEEQVEDKDVQRALAYLCRTSHRFRRLAQPVLWQRVVLGDGARLDKLLRHGAPASLGHFTEQFVIKPDVSISSGRTVFECRKGVSIATVCPKVVELVVNLFNPRFFLASLDHRLVASHKYLRRLSLVHLEITDHPLPSLAHLEELSVTHCKAKPDIIRNWIAPLHMPSLRVMHIASILSDVEYAPLDILLDNSIIAQVDVMRIHCRVLSLSHETPELARSTSPPVLVDHAVGRSALNRHELCFKPSAEQIEYHRYYSLDDTLQFLRNDPTAGSVVLVFPRSFLALARTSVDFAAALVDVEAQCAIKGARISWYNDDDPFSIVPREFVQYARELKAARRAREEKGGRA
ncbi:uncharacterized protein RHOBADRAFT_55989 [Rhodotorula graminis WP1]|uniref:Uncharacterized protein n=1 Tax=Rhodotorula graminis (strain WP1) TaxID=578459 RepID=A0A0P9ES28_RHOGW|nr:uncharacterized protein RHOBADRAFT_55989 [Rhodotorula graminis WP1]KPV72155.1 hypothetical protein RHOBADRAFT_55989 [Rhodotorula graminis WP1]